jgi:hypothetical protein
VGPACDRMALMKPLAFVALALFVGGQAASDPETALRSAMGSYYAALAASGRGNVEATQRQLVLFEARWAGASKLARTSAPEALRSDPAWAAALDNGAAALGRALAALRIQDAGGAHAELESIRLRLRDVRARHNLETIDDRLTDFHESMERLISRISARNEIVLTESDWEAIGPQIENAKRSLQQIDAAAGSAIRKAAGWTAAFGVVQANLVGLEKAVARRDGFGAATVAERLHDRYYDLLLAISRIG